MRALSCRHATLAVLTVACATPGATPQPVAPASTPPVAAAGTGDAASPAPASPAPAVTATPTPAVEVRFLERSARDAPWTPIAEPDRRARLTALIDNEPARFALDLYALAWELAPPPELDHPVLFVGVEPGGNHAEVGLTVDDGGVRRAFPALPYLRLAEDDEVLRGTLLHETGHAIHALLARGAPELAGDPTVAPIPHSTAAVTDRRTALAEGLAIHLEAVDGHCGRDPATRRFYDHDAPPLGPTGDKRSEYFFPARDLMTYAQTFARYQRVRDGEYAFETAARGDYLRVQLDPARDLRTLRDPGSLMASEGFVAAVLFRVIVADGCGDGLAALVPRYRALWTALRQAETTAGPLDAAPLLDVVAAWGAPAITAFLDLSRGVTIDGEAAARWAALYDAALALDLPARDRLIAELETRRAGWLADATADPTRLAARLGPVVPVEVAAVSVRLVAFGAAAPLRFDVNAAGAPMLGLVPGWGPAAVATIVAERDRRPFADLADLRTRLAAHRVATRALGR